MTSLFGEMCIRPFWLFVCVCACGVRGENGKVWECWQLLFVDGSVLESGVPVGGIVPGGV